MASAVSVTETQVMTVLGRFLLSVLPSGTQVIRAQVNRVPEPKGPFVLMTPLMRKRLATSEDNPNDIAFIGSISGNTLTVTAILAGEIGVGLAVTGAAVSAGTVITAFQGGSGGIGTYTVSPSQTVSSTTLQGGTISVLMRTQLSVQLDVFGAGTADNAQIIATLFRDAYAVDFFADQNNFPPGVFFEIAPLFTTDPRQLVFVNGEQQYQERWSLDAHLQVNPTVSVAQQFADALSVNLISVDAEYPPS